MLLHIRSAMMCRIAALRSCCRDALLLLSGCDPPSRYSLRRTSFRDGAFMSTRTARLFVLCGFLMAGVALQAHHAVAGVYDLNKEVVLEGRLKKLNFTNPHASIELSVPNKKIKGKVTDWKLTTASVQTLTRRGNQQDLDEAWRDPQGDDPSGEERQPDWIHQESPARRPQHQALLRRRHGLT